MKAYKINFPKDHCFHTNNNEWVYFSGVVETSEGKRFGLMFTIFQYRGFGRRFSYPSMLGISDLDEKKFYDVRIRGGNGKAGNTSTGLPLIDAGNSRFKWTPADNLYIFSSGKIRDNTGISLEMNMKPTRDVILHGEDGFIPMGDGNPSGYYSLTNLLPIKGILRMGNNQYGISGGRMWMDRQWGDWSGAGWAWDWFSFRFDDSGALMVLQFPYARDDYIKWNWTYRDLNNQIHYGTNAIIIAKRIFKQYPVEWTVTLPSIDAEFEVKPIFDNQAFSGLWEGLCDVNGEVRNSKQTGHAFVELSGY